MKTATIITIMALLLALAACSDTPDVVARREAIEREDAAGLAALKLCSKKTEVNYVKKSRVQEPDAAKGEKGYAVWLLLDPPRVKSSATRKTERRMYSKSTLQEVDTA